MHVHLLHPTTVDEVVDVATTQSNRQGVVDVADGNAQGAGLLVIDFELELRLVIQTVRTYLRQHFALRRHAEELVACLHQFFMTDTGAVLQEHVETGGVTQLQYRWRSEGEHHGIAEGEEVLLGTGRHLEHAVVGVTIIPRAQHDERHTRALATAGEVEAGHGKHRVHRVAFAAILARTQQEFAHFVDDHLGALGRRAGRGLHLGEQYTLVFFRQERRWNAGEQPDHANHDQQVRQQIRDLALQDIADTAFVAANAAVEIAVEPAKETALGYAVLAFRDRLEHGGAKRRGEDQRDQYRQGHGRDDGDRELLVDHTGGTAEERHWQQNRRQHQGDTDQCALDLAHGLLGGFLG
ncbi:hypothetical protein D3C87_1168980 [compost metagenome]